jgi:hypothetical protein
MKLALSFLLITLIAVSASPDMEFWDDIKLGNYADKPLRNAESLLTTELLAFDSHSARSWARYDTINITVSTSELGDFRYVFHHDDAAWSVFVTDFTVVFTFYMLPSSNNIKEARAIALALEQALGGPKLGHVRLVKSDIQLVVNYRSIPKDRRSSHNNWNIWDFTIANGNNKLIISIPFDQFSNPVNLISYLTR